MELNNGIIKVTISKHGAELKSVVKDGREYMWNADPKFWSRTSPVLFPFVGGLRNNKFRHNGVEYMGIKHGFARDCDFKLVDMGEDFVTFLLEDSEETLKAYPFKFKLYITYVLDGAGITVKWVVENPNDCDMPFSIGAHPAFNLKPDGNFFKFDNKKDITYRLIDAEGLVMPDKEYILENNGYAPIMPGMFNKDAFIIEGEQAKTVSLCDKDKNEYIRVSFTSPLFGLWQPVGEDVPFVCIEPWYGRCDRNDFTGELKDREYGNIIPKKEVFEAEYSMEFI